MSRQAEQVNVIAQAGADVVALQEVTARTLPLWRAAFDEMGLGACETALDGAPGGSGRRLLGALTAARALVHGLRERGWVDAFRALHGYSERDASWTFSGDRGGWRLDHVLVQNIEPVASAYAHDWRRAGLSDHSALVVDLRR